MFLSTGSKSEYAMAQAKRLIISPVTLFLLLVLVVYESANFLDFKSLPFGLSPYQPAENELQVALPPDPEKFASIATPQDLAANTTLGFETILALSPGPSWRTRGLAAAAELTGLDITIPYQPPISEELLDAFRHIGDGTASKQPTPGTARAWLAHIDLLRFVIASGFETAFIVEDDVDWDLAIKTQMRLVSENVRNYTNVPPEDHTPFGTNNWDVLWLGHCGSWIIDNMKEPLVYSDETRISIEDYSGWARTYMRDRIPEGHRWVQESVQTVCTFGYGVTKASAPKILSLLSKGKGEAFDVHISDYCKSGDLECVVVNPQLFNHYEPPKEAGYVSGVHAGDGLGQQVDESNFEDKKGYTGNIVNSARCKALFNETCVRPGSDLM